MCRHPGLIHLVPELGQWESAPERWSPFLWLTQSGFWIIGLSASFWTVTLTHSNENLCHEYRSDEGAFRGATWGIFAKLYPQTLTLSQQPPCLLSCPMEKVEALRWALPQLVATSPAHSRQHLSFTDGTHLHCYPLVRGEVAPTPGSAFLRLGIHLLTTSQRPSYPLSPLFHHLTPNGLLSISI